MFRRRRGAEEPERRRERGDDDSPFIPARGSRRGFESLVVRIIATGGVVGIGTALAAILGSQDVSAWIIGLAVSGVVVVLAAILWSSRTL
jgi:L-alanine-DL-glutamate epimerase-like enolase superfamily enzyme